MFYRFIIIASAVILTACAKPEPQNQAEDVRPVRYMQVGMNKDIAERRFPGRAKAVNDVTLAFEVPGKLNEVMVSVGDHVQQGDLLASIDDRDYRNARDQAKAEAQRAKAQYQRMKRALADKAVSSQNVTDAQAAYKSAQAVLNTRQKALDDTRLLAPYDAIVSATFVDNFGNVQAKQPAVRLVDPSRIEMVADIPESMIRFAERGMQVYVSFDAFPETTLAATVNDIGAEADEATRTFPVTFVMDQPEGVKIFPGMAGEAWPADPLAFVDRAPKQFQGFKIPLSALLSESDQKTVVWVIDPDTQRVSQRVVVVGDMTEAGVLVQGLNGGEYIATAGVHHLVDQQKVKLSK